MKKFIAIALVSFTALPTFACYTKDDEKNGFMGSAELYQQFFKTDCGYGKVLTFAPDYDTRSIIGIQRGGMQNILRVSLTKDAPVAGLSTLNIETAANNVAKENGWRELSSGKIPLVLKSDDAEKVRKMLVEENGGIAILRDFGYDLWQQGLNSYEVLAASKGGTFVMSYNQKPKALEDFERLAQKNFDDAKNVKK